MKVEVEHQASLESTLAAFFKIHFQSFAIWEQGTVAKTKSDGANPQVISRLNRKRKTNAIK